MYKKTMFLLVLLLVLSVLAGGCFSRPAPKEPVDEPEELLFPDYAWEDSGATGLSVPGSPSGVEFGKLFTYSDGTNLYLQVVYKNIGYGQNFWVLIDNTRIQSGYNPSLWDSKWGVWWGNMGMEFVDDFFDPDFIMVRARSWDGDVGILKETDHTPNGDEGGNANAMGPDDESCLNVYNTLSDIQSESGKNIVFTIPYASIGKEKQSQSGDELQIIVMVGREVWAWDGPEGKYIDDRPLGMQAMMPADGEITGEGTPEARIAKVKSAIKYTLK